MHNNLVIYPFGYCEKMQKLHSGRLFDVYSGTLGGKGVCLKMPRLPLNSIGFGASFESVIRVGSEAFGDTFSSTQLGSADLSLLLQAEMETVRSTAGAWNHDVTALGVFQCSTETSTLDQHGEPVHAGFLPVAVMPLHWAKPLAEHNPQEKMYLFPRMLVSLWNALCAQPHGDLSEGNILVEDPATRFILIDPGVYLGQGHATSRGPYQRRTLFTTNIGNYPILFPHQHSAEGRWYGDKTLTEIAELGLDARFALTRWPQGAGIAANVSAELKSRPTAADLQALGFMYYRIVTSGNELSPAFGILHAPAWYGDFGYTSERSSEADLRYEKFINYETFEALRARLALLSQEDAALTRALVMLEIKSRDHLEGLAADVTQRRS